MKSVLYRELTYTFMKQLFVTIVFIIVGSIVLPKLPLGMNDDMLGISGFCAWVMPSMRLETV